jgi:beta-lactamase regulating signal transducer with metallopeptidase domain
VLLHELGHVRRLDGLFVILSRIACALYWFHPLVWWVQRRAREDAERACDLLVVEEGISPSRYARHLLEIIRSARRPGAALAPTMASPSHMARRIAELTELTPAASRVGKAAATFVLFTMILSTVLLAAASVPGALSPQEGASACSDVRPLLESQPEPTVEGPQSVEPELFTPAEGF